MQPSSISTTSTPTHSGVLFDQLVLALQAHFAATIAQHGPQLFRVELATARKGADLYDRYLDALPTAERQHHTCTTCRAFAQRYGSLACVDADGNLIPAVWPASSESIPEPYRAAVAALHTAVRRGTISGVALLTDAVLGTPLTEPWTHFALTLPQQARYRPTGVLSAAQAEAAKREDYGTLQHGLAEFPPALVAQAVTLLESDALTRSEKVIGPARFLLDLHTQRAQVAGARHRDHVT